MGFAVPLVGGLLSLGSTALAPAAAGAAGAGLIGASEALEAALIPGLAAGASSFGGASGLGGLLGSASSMLPGMDSLMKLGDIFGTTGTTKTATEGASFMDSLKSGFKIGNTLKDLMGDVGKGPSEVPIMLPAQPTAAQMFPTDNKQKTATASPAPTPIASLAQSLAGYRSGYTPTADTTMRAMFGR